MEDGLNVDTVLSRIFDNSGLHKLPCSLPILQDNLQTSDSEAHTASLRGGGWLSDRMESSTLWSTYRLGKATSTLSSSPRKGRPTEFGVDVGAARVDRACYTNS
jgi:hypothetical protein